MTLQPHALVERNELLSYKPASLLFLGSYCHKSVEWFKMKLLHWEFSMEASDTNKLACVRTYCRLVHIDAPRGMFTYITIGTLSNSGTFSSFKLVRTF